MMKQMNITEKDASRNSKSSQPKFQKIILPNHIGKNTVNIKERLIQRKIGDQATEKLDESENTQNLNSKVGYQNINQKNTIYAKFSNENQINKSVNLGQRKMIEKMKFFDENGSHKRCNSFPFDAKNTNFNGITPPKYLNKICQNEIYLKK